jgi:hypothetical protein
MPLSIHAKKQFKLEADFHAKVANILKEPKFIAALDEIHDNPDLEEKVQANPRKFLESKGVKLPTDPGWEVTAFAGNFSFRICFRSHCIRITVTRG